eukprot:30234-Pelagococcus_subviridis.AAC.6
MIRLRSWIFARASRRSASVSSRSSSVMARRRSRSSSSPMRSSPKPSPYGSFGSSASPSESSSEAWGDGEAGEGGGVRRDEEDLGLIDRGVGESRRDRSTGGRIADAPRACGSARRSHRRCRT